MISRSAVFIAGLSLFAWSGCSKKPAEGGVHLSDVESAFGKEGWKLSEWKPTDPSRFSAQKCVTGSIDGLEAIVCEFGSAESVQRGRRATEAWIAQAVTGVALDNGRTTLGLADRGRVDPNGKITHRVTAAYRGIK